jgi:hypothetical protein
MLAVMAGVCFTTRRVIVLLPSSIARTIGALISIGFSFCVDIFLNPPFSPSSKAQ